jgi:hypothetical protein
MVIALLDRRKADGTTASDDGARVNADIRTVPDDTIILKTESQKLIADTMIKRLLLLLRIEMEILMHSEVVN